MRCVHVGGQPYDDGTPPKIEDARVAKLRLLQQLQVQVQTLNRLKSLQEQKRLARSKEVSYLPQKKCAFIPFISANYTCTCTRGDTYPDSVRDIFINVSACALKVSCMQHG